jgi:hypothetical protein
MLSYTIHRGNLNMDARALWPKEIGAGSNIITFRPKAKTPQTGEFEKILGHL